MRKNLDKIGHLPNLTFDKLEIGGDDSFVPVSSLVAGVSSQLSMHALKSRVTKRFSCLEWIFFNEYIKKY